MVPADGLRQVLDVGKLAGLAGVAEVGSQRGELAGGVAVSIRRGGCGSVVQIGRNLRRDLFVLGRVGLLELLQRAHQFGKRRKLAAVGGRGFQRRQVETAEAARR